MAKSPRAPKPRPVADAPTSSGRCLCGEVAFEIDVPARWAWHDHSAATRRALGTAAMTWVGSWKSRFRFTAGEAAVIRFEDVAAGAVRAFCGRCGTPLTYQRGRASQMVNIPRGLFAERTGREPRYHVAFGEAPDWAWTGEALAPLKGFPGVLWERPRKKKARAVAGLV